MYQDIDHYLSGFAYLLPAALLCYWVAYGALRLIGCPALRWPAHAVSFGMASLVAPFAVPFWYRSLAGFMEAGGGPMLIIGFFSSLLVLTFTYLTGKGRENLEANFAKAATHSAPLTDKHYNSPENSWTQEQSMRHAFCAPVIIEGPSPAIGGEKLVEDVGLATTNADFTTILDKFSWVPHSRTFRTQLPTPTPKRVTVTFARRKSAFSPECTTLGTFLLTGFSGKDEVANTLEIRVNAIDSGLTFEVRDAAGSNLAITRKRDDGNLRK